MSATTTYFERERAFYKMRADLDYVTAHPDFVAPEHPYIDQLKTMSKYAVFGVIDACNGLLHAGSHVFTDSVVIAPVLKSDLKTRGVSVTTALLRRSDQDEVFDFSALQEGSGVCEASELLRCPIISLAPYMYARHPIIVGSTILHELDHAYWWLRRKSKFKEYDASSDECIAAQEISANRLEQQVFFAHLPNEYDEQYGNVSLRYADGDFERPYNPRDADKLRKSVKIIAFINYMFDTLGADIGKKPTTDIVAALKAQKLM